MDIGYRPFYFKCGFYAFVLVPHTNKVNHTLNHDCANFSHSSHQLQPQHLFFYDSAHLDTTANTKGKHIWNDR